MGTMSSGDGQAWAGGQSCFCHVSGVTLGSCPSPLGLGCRACANRAYLAIRPRGSHIEKCHAGRTWHGDRHSACTRSVTVTIKLISPDMRSAGPAGRDRTESAPVQSGMVKPYSGQCAGRAHQGGLTPWEDSFSAEGMW